MNIYTIRIERTSQQTDIIESNVYANSPGEARRIAQRAIESANTFRPIHRASTTTVTVSRPLFDRLRAGWRGLFGWLPTVSQPASQGGQSANADATVDHPGHA